MDEAQLKIWQNSAAQVFTSNPHVQSVLLDIPLDTVNEIIQRAGRRPVQLAFSLDSLGTRWTSVDCKWLIAAIDDILTPRPKLKLKLNRKALEDLKRLSEQNPWGHDESFDITRNELPPIEEAAPWKYGYCEQCGIEITPAMDGEGAVVCSGCSR